MDTIYKYHSHCHQGVHAYVTFGILRKDKYGGHVKDVFIDGKIFTLG